MDDDQICLHHETMCLKKYETMQKRYCNPFGKQNHHTRTGLLRADVEMAGKLNCLTRSKIKPGQKIGSKCKADARIAETSIASSSSSDDFDMERKQHSSWSKGASLICATWLKRHTCKQSFNDAIYLISKTSNTGTKMPGLRISQLLPGNYVACIYDDKWWIGNIVEALVEESDTLIKFMCPHGLASSFYWPKRHDICWELEQHLISVLPVPSVTSSRQLSVFRKNFGKREPPIWSNAMKKSSSQSFGLGANWRYPL